MATRRVGHFLFFKLVWSCNIAWYVRFATRFPSADAAFYRWALFKTLPRSRFRNL